MDAATDTVCCDVDARAVELREGRCVECVGAVASPSLSDDCSGGRTRGGGGDVVEAAPLGVLSAGRRGTWLGLACCGPGASELADVVVVVRVVVVFRGDKRLPLFIFFALPPCCDRCC
jgi:hypothetical protein